MDTKISIIIPVYNVEKFLKECLDSILHQTFQDYEIICIDDGSSDRSLDILQEYKRKDNRFVIIRQKHFGAGAARNLGIKYAKSKYLQFLDADDCFEPTFLEEMYRHAEKFNADITVCSARKINSDGITIETNNPLWPLNLDKVPLERVFNRKNYPEDIFGLFCVVPWNKLYRKNLIVDNAHSFYSKPIGIASFNSIRKFFPEIRDGAILYSSKIMDFDFPIDEFYYEMKKLDYNEIIKNEKRIDDFDIKIISNCTSDLFSKIDFESEKNRRLLNFYDWHEKLKNSNSLDINLEKGEIPFCYPYLAKFENDANTLVKKIESQGITIYRYWEKLPDSFLENIFQKQLVAIPLC